MAAPKRQVPRQDRAGRRAGKARRIASLSAAAAMVVGVGAASAIFVDYLADRALARAAETPATVVNPVVAKAAEAEAAAKVAALAPDAAQDGAPVKPPETEIAAATPDPAAIAKVAIGPEHAIELPGRRPDRQPDPSARRGGGAEDVRSPSTRLSRTRSRSRQTPKPTVPPTGRRPRRSSLRRRTRARRTAVKKPKRQKAGEGQAAGRRQADRGRVAARRRRRRHRRSLIRRRRQFRQHGPHGHEARQGQRRTWAAWPRCGARDSGGQPALQPQEGLERRRGRAGRLRRQRAVLRRLVRGRLQRQKRLGLQELPGEFEARIGRSRSRRRRPLPRRRAATSRAAPRRARSSRRGSDWRLHERLTDSARCTRGRLAAPRCVPFRSGC